MLNYLFKLNFRFLFVVLRFCVSFQDGLMFRAKLWELLKNETDVIGIQFDSTASSAVSSVGLSLVPVLAFAIVIMLCFV